MKEQFLDMIDAITPRQFFVLYVGVWVVLLLLGYFLAGGFYVFMTAIMLITSVIVVYKYQKPPIAKSNSLFLVPLFGLLYSGIFYSGLLFQPELIDNKSQAQMMTGVIPDTHEYVRGSGKGAKSYYYLNIDGKRFHCDDDQYDDCENIYAYKGQTATVYHYDGLAYEIDVGGQKVYEFNAQAQKFKATQNKKKWQFIWALILFGIPSVGFYFLNKIVIRDLEVIDESQQDELIKTQKQQHQTFKSRVGVGGYAWRTLFALLGTLALLLFLVHWIGGQYPSMAGFLVMTVGAYYAASLPYQNAKREIALYNEYLADGEELGELSDYESSGFYNHMGVVSWVLMYVFGFLTFLCLCIVAWSFEWDNGKLGAFVGIFGVLVFGGVLFVVIKRAMSRRDWAFE